MLDEKDTLALLRRAKAGDASAKEELLSHNTSLLKSILRRYLGKGVEYDDLYQLACMGFLKAIAGFDESYGVRFSTYAVPMIAGEIKRFLRDDGSVKVSRLMKKCARDMNLYIEQCVAARGEQPSVRELSEKFGMDESEVVFTLGSARMPVSLYEQGDYKDEKGTTLADRLPDPEDQEEIFKNSPFGRQSENCPNARKRSSFCASSATSRKAKSPAASASRRCRSPASKIRSWQNSRRNSADLLPRPLLSNGSPHVIKKPLSDKDGSDTETARGRAACRSARAGQATHGTERRNGTGGSSGARNGAVQRHGQDQAAHGAGPRGVSVGTGGAYKRSDLQILKKRCAFLAATPFFSVFSLTFFCSE